MSRKCESFAIVLLNPSLYANISVLNAIMKKYFSIRRVDNANAFRETTSIVKLSRCNIIS